MFFVKLPQNRHPERSASPIDRVTLRLWRGVEGPRRCLFDPCCSELFNHRARTRRASYDLPRRAVGAVGLPVASEKETTLQKSRRMRGPEGRSSKRQPSPEGLGINPQDDQSAVGAALTLHP